MNQTLVALTPAAVPAVQADLREWCQAQILSLSQELREARMNLREVKRLMLGSPKGWQTVIRKTIARMLYFAKIKAAIEAGYLIVPNFTAEVIAVRVPEGKDARSVLGHYPTQINVAEPVLTLPPGQGRYVDETLHFQQGQRAETDGKGGTVMVRWARSTGYDTEVDFPLALVKPVILGATERAMSLKIFDRIAVAYGQGQTLGSARQQKSDPVVVGQILDGSKPHPRDHVVSFFIAWWLDPRSL